jgi:hypothetical protein
MEAGKTYSTEKPHAIGVQVKPIVMCSVCAGNKPISGKPCVCGGYGTQQDEMSGLRKEAYELQKIIQMCFEDACKPSGKISKKTVIALMKHADTSA